MLEEYNRLYALFGAPLPLIYATGIPRFDIYFSPINDRSSISRFQKKYQINGSDKIILFATSAPVHFPNQTDIVKHLLQYSARKQNIKIIVRCHPSDDFKLYEQFQNEANCRIWYENNFKENSLVSSKFPDLHTLHGLYEMLEYCNVCINVASTIRLEAAACNKPGISIAYDGDVSLPFPHSVKRFYSYNHQIPLNNMGIDTMVYSKNELFNALDKTFSSSVKRSYHEKIRKFIHHSGPFAVSNTMNYIQQWLG